MTIDTAAIDAVMRDAIKAADVPGAAVAVVVGDAVYAQGYGIKEAEKEDPVTPGTLFAIGSTTKAFTTTAMALLMDDGKMTWDDPVRRHLPEFRLSDPLADANVTLRDLACHRTGLPRHDMLWLGSPWDRAEILRRIGLAKPTASFRSVYQYQNICFMAAGEAVARAANTPSFEAFVQSRLLDPLGMDGTNFSTRDAEKSADHAAAHRRGAKNKIEVIPWRNLDNVGPAGSINAGARDLARWVRFQLAGGVTPDGTRLVSEVNLCETHTPQMVIRIEENTRALYPDTTQMSYGLGWSLFDYRGGNKIIAHGGAIGGFRAQVALAPGANVGVAVLANIPSYLPEMARNLLLDYLLGLPAHDWSAAYASQLKRAEDEQKKRKKEKKAGRHKKTSPSRELSAYVGTYSEPAYGTVTINRKGRGLALAWSSFDCKLNHFHFDTFTATTSDPALDDEDVVFTLGADGSVTTLSLFGATFQKVKSDSREATR